MTTTTETFKETRRLRSWLGSLPEIRACLMLIASELDGLDDHDSFMRIKLEYPDRDVVFADPADLTSDDPASILGLTASFRSYATPKLDVRVSLSGSGVYIDASGERKSQVVGIVTTARDQLENGRSPRTTEHRRRVRPKHVFAVLGMVAYFAVIVINATGLLWSLPVLATYAFPFVAWIPLTLMGRVVVGLWYSTYQPFEVCEHPYVEPQPKPGLARRFLASPWTVTIVGGLIVAAATALIVGSSS